MAIAAAVVAVVVLVVVVVLEHGKKGPTVTPISAPLDPYAASLPITHLQMSESGNLAGSKVTYVDGVLENTGNKTVTGASFQILFRNYAHEVVQNNTQPLKLIRTRVPYVDVETAASDPLKPGTSKEFRLAFDGVASGWDGAFPEIRIVQVESK